VPKARSVQYLDLGAVEGAPPLERDISHTRWMGYAPVLSPSRRRMRQPTPTPSAQGLAGVRFRCNAAAIVSGYGTSVRSLQEDRRTRAE
jgi:hypothetical protein